MSSIDVRLKACLVCSSEMSYLHHGLDSLADGIAGLHGSVLLRDKIINLLVPNGMDCKQNTRTWVNGRDSKCQQSEGV